MILLIALTACTTGDGCPTGTVLQADGFCHPVSGAGDSGAGDGGADGGEGDGGEGDGGAVTPQVQWTADEAMAHLDDALALGFPDTIPVVDEYVRHLSQREATCPSMENPDQVGENGAWQTDYCQTTAGFVYQGFAMYEAHCNDGSKNDKEPGVGIRVHGMVAQFTLHDPDGHAFIGGGNLAQECRWYPDGTGRCIDQLGGSYTATGADPLLAGGIEASLDVEHSWGDDGSVTHLQGGVGYPVLDLSFQDVVMDWQACDGRPTGSVRLRDPSGWWYELHLDDDCSGCGGLWLADQDLGHYCPDLVTPVRAVLDRWETPCWD